MPLRPGTPGAQTRPLAPVASGAPVAGQATVPLRPGQASAPMPRPGATATLPQATKPLASGPMSRPVAGPVSGPISQPLKSADQDYDEDHDPDAGMIGFGIAALLASLAVLGVILWGSDKAEIMDPKPVVPAWESKSPVDGVWRSTFETQHLSKTPEVAVPEN